MEEWTDMRKEGPLGFCNNDFEGDAKVSHSFAILPPTVLSAQTRPPTWPTSRRWATGSWKPNCLPTWLLWRGSWRSWRIWLLISQTARLCWTRLSRSLSKPGNCCRKPRTPGGHTHSRTRLLLLIHAYGNNSVLLIPGWILKHLIKAWT